MKGKQLENAFFKKAVIFRLLKIKKKNVGSSGKGPRRPVVKAGWVFIPFIRQTYPLSSKHQRIVL